MLGHMAKHGYPDTFPDDGSILNTTKTQGCSYIPFTPEEYNLILTNSFWLEEVFQTAIGLLGIIGNLTAITIYCTSGSKFYTIFYRLLISLLFVQIGVDDLLDGHATNPAREYGVAQILNCFGFDSFKNSYFGGFIGVGDDEFVVTI